MHLTLPDIIACLACTGTFWRVFLFRRLGLRYRIGISLLAWLLAASAGATALNIIFGRVSISWGEAGICAVMCVATFLARGNLAHLMRYHHDP